MKIIAIISILFMVGCSPDVDIINSFYLIGNEVGTGNDLSGSGCSNSVSGKPLEGMIGEVKL